MAIKVYTLVTCPRCKVLKMKLQQKDIPYEECQDEEEMIRLGISSVPVMMVDGERMEFPDAIKYIDER